MDCGPDGKAFRRLNAIHLLLLGAPYKVVLRNSRVNERTFRLWVERFNEQGIDGLIYKPQAGRPRKISTDQVARDILPVVDDPSLADHTHWTVTKLCGWLREEKQLELSYRTLVRYLHEHNYARRIPRRMPEPPDRDNWEKQREIFGGELITLLEDPSCDVDPLPNTVTNSMISSSTRSEHYWIVRKQFAPSVKPIPNNGNYYWQRV
jgi:transposase